MVHLKTSLGVIVLELEYDKAPGTVENFLKYIKQGFYDGTIFHRVIDRFVIQAGAFVPGMSQKPTLEPIRNEAHNGLRNARGSLAMARPDNDAHSATSQFFINVADNDFLNYTASTNDGWGYCVFGQVVDGIDIVDQIRGVPTTTRFGFKNVPVGDILIKSITSVKIP